MCMDAYIESQESGQPEDIARLGRSFDHLHSLAAAQIFTSMARSMHTSDITFSQLNALFRLYTHGPQRIADLAEGAHLSHCATSRLISRLAKEGQVDKQPNAQNRRERLISLTPEGLAFLRSLKLNTTAAYENLFRTLPSSLTDRLQAVLDDILPLLPPPEMPG
ncbi:regulatory protein MarR [Pseudodesulfovibrio mercurii]|uniref:Regulatory protein MarR n=2 Tax=Pseudodesulfovibrio mercurii TaxID=641491 RepID=F0JCD6_9BACT|nr:regulatory protein MarR [Pseudodesulfovibrio mercurii]